MLTETQTFSEYITKNMLKETFEKYVYNKTDNLTEEHLVKVPEGLDGVKVDLIKETFHLDCQVINDPVSNTPLIVPIGRHHV